MMMKQLGAVLGVFIPLSHLYSRGNRQFFVDGARTRCECAVNTAFVSGRTPEANAGDKEVLSLAQLLPTCEVARSLP